MTRVNTYHHALARKKNAGRIAISYITARSTLSSTPAAPEVVLFHVFNAVPITQ